MTLANHLPFVDISDEDFIDLFIVYVPYKYSLTDLEIMQFDNFVGDVSAQDHDPDNFILGSLGFVNPVSHYYFPDSSLGSKLNDVRDTSLTLITYNINSIPMHFNDFIEQCLGPIDHNFDLMGFCETKLTSDIEHLYTISS